MWYQLFSSILIYSQVIVIYESSLNGRSRQLKEFPPVCGFVQRRLLLRLITWACGLAILVLLADRASWGRARSAAGADARCSSSWWYNSWVEGSLLTPNQLSLTGTVKYRQDKPIRNTVHLNQSLLKLANTRSTRQYGFHLTNLHPVDKSRKISLAALGLELLTKKYCNPRKFK